jgi:hypothetical protein
MLATNHPMLIHVESVPCQRESSLPQVREEKLSPYTEIFYECAERTISDSRTWRSFRSEIGHEARSVHV